MSGPSHSRVHCLLEQLEGHDSVGAVELVEVDDAHAVGAVLVDAGVVGAVGGLVLRRADYMPGMYSSTIGCIVLHSSSDLRILDIDS